MDFTNNTVEIKSLEGNLLGNFHDDYLFIVLLIIIMIIVTLCFLNLVFNTKQALCLDGNSSGKSEQGIKFNNKIH